MTQNHPDGPHAWAGTFISLYDLMQGNYPEDLGDPNSKALSDTSHEINITGKVGGVKIG